MAPVFETEAHRELYELVDDYLTVLEFEYAKHENPTVMEITVNEQSPKVYASVQPYTGPGGAFVLLTAWLLHRPVLSSDLMRHLLLRNATFIFGKFAVDEDDDLSLKHAMSGADLVKDDLALMINVLADLAATETLFIISQFGGAGTKMGDWTR